MSNQVEQLEMKPAAKGSALSNSPVGKIIVVDDEPELKNILVEALSAQGFEVRGCGSGQQALEELRQKEFDLLLTDLMMPEMDGIALLEAAVKIDPHLIGIMMTGQGTIQTAVDAMKVGAFDYVLKPFRLQTVMPVLTRAINTRRLRMENLQLRETVAIYSLCQTIAFTLDAQTVLSRLADAALQQSDADEVSILLPTNDGKELFVAAVRGEKRERLLGERVPLQESISSWVARERTPLILNGEVKDERFVALWPRPEIRSAVSVPMQVANKLVGIINLNLTNRLRPFTLGQMKALTILASTAAAALESASLYTQVQHAEKNYRSIFENAVEGIFQSTPDRRPLTVNPAMAHILGYESPEEVVNSFTDIGKQLFVDQALPAEVTRTLEERGVLQGFEFEAYRKDRAKIWLSLNIRGVRDEKGAEVCREGTIEDITERKRAEAERLVMFEIIQGSITTRNLDEFLKLIQKSIGKLLYAENCFVGLYDETTSLMHFEYWADQFDAVPLPHPPGKGFSSYVLRTNKPLLLTEEIKSRMYGSGEVEKSGRSSASWLGVPLRMSSRALGVLVVQHYEDKNAYSQRDLEFLSSVGDQIALAIERKQAEKALRESEERYRDLVENAHDLIYEHDLEGNYISANKAVEQITGYSLEESFHLNLAQVVAPDYLEKSQELFHRKLAGERVTAYEMEIIAKDGHRVAVEVNSSLVLRDGVPVGVRGIARDITERKLAEEGLRESEERYRLLFESNPQPVWVYDLETLAFLAVNESAVHHYGYSREDFLAMTIKDIRPAEDIPALYESVAGSSEGVDAAGIWRHLKKDGTIIEVEITSHLLVFDDRRAELILAHDITERKRAEADLVRLAAAVEQTADSIVITDLKGNIQYVNPAFERITGYAKEEVLNQNSRILKSGKTDPAVYKELWEMIARGDVWIGHLTNRRKDGTLFEERVTISAIFDESHEIVNYVAVKQDISDFIQLEEQLRQSQKMEAIGQLAGGVAHDFNNLLTVIGGYSSILLNKLDQDSPFRTSVEEIKKASDRASGLTRQLLAFSRKQILQPKILDLNVVVSDLDKMVRRLIGEDIDLLAITDPNLGKVKADPGQIEQVLLNLIVNARDAMPGGGKLTIETANAALSADYALSHAAVGGPYVMLAVSDTGCGMDAELQKHVFEPFFTTKVTSKGTGLGLATVYGIVKQSDGHIWLYSEPGKGTSFKIYLPCVDEIVADQANAAGMPLVPKGTETLLLVEDEDQVRQIVQAILEQQGYDVLPAANGEEALKLAELHGSKIDLLLTDVVMPQMSGRELAQELTTILPQLKVLYMSGYTDDAIVRHGLLDASLSFIQKPFDAATAARKVREVLDSQVR